MYKKNVLLVIFVLLFILLISSPFPVIAQAPCDTRLLRSPALDNFDNWVDKFSLSLAGYPGAPMEQEYIYVLDYDDRISAYDDWSLLVGTNTALVSIIKLEISISYANTSGQSSDFVTIADFTPTSGVQALYKFTNLEYTEPGGFPLIAAVRVRGYLSPPSSDDPLNPSPYFCGVTPCSVGLDVLKFELYPCPTPTPTGGENDCTWIEDYSGGDPEYNFTDGYIMGSWPSNPFVAARNTQSHFYDSGNDWMSIEGAAGSGYSGGYYTILPPDGKSWDGELASGDHIRATFGGHATNSRGYLYIHFTDDTSTYNGGENGTFGILGADYIDKTVEDMFFIIESIPDNTLSFDYLNVSIASCAEGWVPTATPTVAGTFTSTPSPTVTGTPPTSTPTVTGTPPTATSTHTATSTPTPFPNTVAPTSTPTPDLISTSTSTPPIDEWNLSLTPVAIPTGNLMPTPSLTYTNVFTGTLTECYISVCGEKDLSLVQFGGCSSWFALPGPSISLSWDVLSSIRSLFIWLGTVINALWFNLNCFLQSLWYYVVWYWNLILTLVASVNHLMCLVGELSAKVALWGYEWGQFLGSFITAINYFTSGSFPAEFLGYDLTGFISGLVIALDGTLLGSIWEVICYLVTIAFWFLVIRRMLRLPGEDLD